MSHKTDKKATPEQAQTLGRRELLKALVATSGAVTAATLLPGKWSKPVIEAGVMPAHAATSGVVTISNLVANRFITSLDDVDGQGDLAGYRATFDYVDEACQVDGDTLLYASTDVDGTLINGDSLSNVGATGYADPCDDSITFPFQSQNWNGTATLTVKINVNGRDSNETSALFPIRDS